MQILDLIKNWISIRRYEQKEVEKEKINAILEAGRRAPSWQNLQPWHFLVISNDSGKKKLAEIVTTVKLIEKAPVVIAVLGNMNGFHLDEAVRLLMEQLSERMSEEDLKKYLDKKMTSPLKVGFETVKARTLEQVAYAAAFMALEACNQGLGACVLGGVENNITEETDKCRGVKEYFGIPENYEIYTLITIGYPNEKPSQRSRKKLEEVSSWEKF